MLQESGEQAGQGRVQVEDVVLGEAKSGLTPIAVERLNARLRFFPLLTGRIEIAEVTLLRDLLKGTPADVKKWTKPSSGN